MKTVLELNKPIKTRKPREVTIAELKAEVCALKRQVKEERAHATAMLGAMKTMNCRMQWLMDHASFERRCTCTPTRADFLRA